MINSAATRNGGAAVYAVNLCLALREVGVDISLWASDQAHGPRTTLDGRATINDLPAGSETLDIKLFPSRQPHRFVYTPALTRELKRAARTYDLIHIHNMFLHPQFAAQRAARRQERPYLVSLHGALDPYSRQHGRTRKAINDFLWQTAMLENANAIHVLTEAERDKSADVAPDVPRLVIASGVQHAHFASFDGGASFRARYLASVRGPVVLFIGRISHKKRVDMLIEALATVHADVRDAVLVVIGPDDEGLTDGLRRLAASLGIAGRVFFTGPLYGEELASAMGCGDVWALPSHTENFGIAVVEALAAGLPVVCSPGVDIAHAMAADNAGLIVDLSPKAFATAITSLLLDTSLNAELRRRGPLHAQRYRWTSIGHEMKRGYEQLLSGVTTSTTPM